MDLAFSADQSAPRELYGGKELSRLLRGYKLLAGFRGGKPVALDALAEAIARLSELASDHRERLAELDVNPIVANSERVTAVDALAVISRVGGNR